MDKPTATKSAIEVPTTFATTTSTASEPAQTQKPMLDKMSLVQALKRYPKAAAWSVFMSTAVIMEGYDIGLLSSFYGFPAFQEKYGTHLHGDKYNVSAAWQSGLTQAMHCGQIFGLLINGWAMERFGYKRTQCAALVTMAAFIFVQFFAPSVGVLCAGEFLIGLPLGIFLTLSTVYAADVCPTPLRPYLTTYVNLCWIIGKFIATGVLRGFTENSTKWAYKIPFSIQWAWAPPLLLGTLLAPESPWWLIRQGRTADARRVMQRLLTSPTDQELDETIAAMADTNQLELQQSAGTAYPDCFRGSDLRRTEIACMTYIIQPMCGFALCGSATYFLEQAGLAADHALDMTLASLAISFVGGLLTWITLTLVGRRRTYLWGLGGIFLVQVVIGCIAIPHLSSGTAWATGVMLLVFNAVYSLSVGPVTYCYVSEVSSTRLRSKTAALARNAYNIFSITNNILTNYQINATAWNWKGKAGFFWAGSCALCFLWAFFRLPETKDRSYHELDVLFESGVRARDFKHTAAITSAVAPEKSLDAESPGDEAFKTAKEL